MNNNILGVSLAVNHLWKLDYHQKIIDDRPYMWVTVLGSPSGVVFKALYDTGAQRTVMSLASYQRIPKPVRDSLRKRPPEVQLVGAFTAQGDKQKDQGSLFVVDLPLQIAGQEIRHPVTICQPLSAQLLVGTDLIHKCGINYSNRKLHFAGMATISCREHLDINPGEVVYANVNLLDDTMISSANLIAENIPVEGDDHFIPSQLIRRIGRHRKATIQVANISPTPINLKPDQILGHARPVDQGGQLKIKQFVQNWNKPISKKTIPILTDKKRDLLKTQLQVGEELDSTQTQRLLELIWKFHYIFAEDEFDLGRTDTLEHRIIMKNDIPTFQKQFRLPD